MDDMLKRLFATAVAVALLGSVAAAAPAPAGPPLEIDVILSLTGPAAFIGQAERASITAEEQVINAAGGVKGRPVHFAIADDTSSPQVGLQLANGIIAKKAQLFLGSPFAAVCGSYLPLVAPKGPVNYCLAPPVHPPNGSYVFTAGASNAETMETVLRYLAGRGLTRVAVLTTTDASGRDFEEGLMLARQRPIAKNFTFLPTEHLNPGDISATAQVAHIKAQDPQALIAWGVGIYFGTMMRAVHEVGLNVPTVGATGAMLYQPLESLAGILPDETAFPGYRAITEGDVRPGPIKSAQDAYFAAMKSAAIKPDAASVTAWDPVLIVIDALRHLGPDATAEQIHAYIENVHGFAGINGIYDFSGGNQRGIFSSAMVIDRWLPSQHRFTVVSKPGGAVK
jgi:branched-chain amino acid transport system substrate-binding protein